MTGSLDSGTNSEAALRYLCLRLFNSGEKIHDSRLIVQLVVEHALGTQEVLDSNLSITCMQNHETKQQKTSHFNEPVHETY
jgi:hypothetical protein